MKGVVFHTLGLIIILILIRAEIVGLFSESSFLSFSELSRLLLFSFQDVIFSLLLGLLFLMISFITRRRKTATSLGFTFFLLCLYLSVLWAIVNTYAVAILNTPINYQLLYYSDLIESDFIADSISSSSYSKILGQSVLAFILLLLVAWLVRSVSDRMLLTTKYKRGALGVLTVVFSFYIIVAYQHFVELEESNYDEVAKIQNPAFVFVGSLFTKSDEGLDFSTRANVTTFSKVRSVDFKVSRNPFIKNVILVVLESVQADYVAGYSKDYDVTPHIEKHLQDALVVKDVYAHSPNSTNSLFSILSSMYPLLSFKNIIKEHPGFNSATLSSELVKQGFTSAFFTSADNTYMGVDKYLVNQGFSEIQDFKALQCEEETLKTDAEGIGGEVKNEKCLVESFLNWFENNSNGPTFSILWTVQTHWPYFVFEKEKAFVTDQPDLNKYLNALHETDAALGQLFERLKQSGEYDSTLIVLVGDHGEAFGEHRQFGHGSNVYEENIKVPLMFINPVLFKNQEKKIVGGHIDVAPTIMELLGFTPSEKWQGVSILDGRREETSYFFSTWSDFLLGYRKGNFKVIHNIYKDKTQVFDLQSDPAEKINLAEKDIDFKNKSKKELGDWIHYHRGVMENRMKEVVH